MTPEQRTERARKAAQARWAKPVKGARKNVSIMRTRRSWGTALGGVALIRRAGPQSKKSRGA